MFRTKSRRNIRSKRNLSRKNRSRKNRNSRRMKGGVFGIPNMGIKRSLGLDRESRLNSQEFRFKYPLLPQERVFQPPYDEVPSMPVEAWNINDGTLCKYAELISKYKYDKSITKEKFEEEEAKLMLFRFRLSDTYPLSEYPNPMSLKAIIDKHDAELLFLYASTDMKCSATIM